MAAKCCRCFPTAPYVPVGLLMLPFLPVCLQSQTGGVPGSPLAPSQNWWELSLSAPLCNQQLAPALSSLANPYLGLLRTTEFLSHCSLLRGICSTASPAGTSWRHFQQSCPVRRAPTRAPGWALLWGEHCSQLRCQHLYQRQLLFCVNHPVMLQGLWQGSCFQKHVLAFIPHSLVFTVLLWFYS